MKGIDIIFSLAKPKVVWKTKNIWLWYSALSFQICVGTTSYSACNALKLNIRRLFLLVFDDDAIDETKTCGSLYQQEG